jgi:hypothetical protein
MGLLPFSELRRKKGLRSPLSRTIIVLTHRAEYPMWVVRIHNTGTHALLAYAKRLTREPSSARAGAS